MTGQQTLTLADFLLARIGEDEGEARRLADRYPHEAKERGRWYGAADEIVVAMPLGTALAECEAKRRIVELHVPQTGAFGRRECSACFETVVGRENTTLDIDYVSMELWPCPTLRLLALPYADHPDYRDEWRP